MNIFYFKNLKTNETYVINAVDVGLAYKAVCEQKDIPLVNYYLKKK